MDTHLLLYSIDALGIDGKDQSLGMLSGQGLLVLIARYPGRIRKLIDFELDFVELVDDPVNVWGDWGWRCWDISRHMMHDLRAPGCLDYQDRIPWSSKNSR